MSYLRPESLRLYGNQHHYDVHTKREDYNPRSKDDEDEYFDQEPYMLTLKRDLANVLTKELTALKRGGAIEDYDIDYNDGMVFLNIETDGIKHQLWWDEGGSLKDEAEPESKQWSLATTLRSNKFNSWRFIDIFSALNKVEYEMSYY